MQINKLISKSELNPLSKRAEMILLGICLVFSTSIFLYATWGGLIWTSDSFHYWAASRSFLAEGVFKSHGGGSYDYWPPLFPVILSFFNYSNHYYYLHILFFNFSLIGIYYSFKRYTHSKKIALISLFVLIITPFPFLTTTFFWSEVAFISFFYSGLYCYYSWTKSYKPILYIFWIILFSLMCLQRNTGMFLVLGIGVYELYDFFSHKKSRKLLINALGLFLAIIPIIIWNISININYSQDAPITQSGFFIDFFTNLARISINLSNTFLPGQYFEIPDIILISIIGALLLLILKIDKKRLYTIIFLTYYLCFSVFPIIDPETLDRFLSPVLPLIIIILVSAFKNYSGKLSRVIKYLALLLISMTLLYNILRTYNNVKMWHERSITNPKASKIFF